MVLAAWLVSRGHAHIVGAFESPELGSQLRSLLVSGRSTLLIGTRGATAISRDGGRRLVRIPALDGFDAMESAVDTSGQTLLVAGPTGALLSADGGVRWRDPTGSLPSRDIEALALDRAAPASLAVYVVGSGLYASDDEGAIWRRLIAPPAQPVGTGFLRGSFLLLPALPSGLLRSRDAGAHWSLTAPDVGGTLIAPDPRNPAHLLLSGSGLLYSSSDDGVSWLQQPLPGGAQLVAQANDGALFATGYTIERHALIWRSRNAGATWATVLAPLP